MNEDVLYLDWLTLDIENYRDSEQKMQIKTTSLKIEWQHFLVKSLLS